MDVESRSYHPRTADASVPRGSAIQYGEEGTPRTDRVPILLRHHPRDLREVAEVVRDPCREQLPERHRAECGMLPLERELPFAERPRVEQGDVVRAEARELVEQLDQRLARALTHVGEPVERLEAPVRALREDELRARYPVGPLAVHEVPDVVEGAECLGTFVPADP